MRVLYSLKIKTLRNNNITLLFTDVGKPCTSHTFLTLQLCLIMLFSKNKILPNFSKFTVLDSCLVEYASVSNIDSGDPVSDETG